MFYHFDVNKWIIQMLPIILRKKSIYAFLRCMLYPLKQLEDAFLAYKEGVDRQLASSSFENTLERFLNRLFFFEYNAIFITDIVAENPCLSFYNESVDPAYMSLVNETPASPLVLSSLSPEDVTGSFIVHVPASLTAADIATVSNWVNYYKIAGTEFSIEVYE